MINPGTIMKKSFFITGILCLLVNFGVQAGCVYEQAIYGEDLPIGTMLHWTTSSEYENMMFVIEKSADGLTFEKVGTVKGNGTTEDISKYHFLDIMTQKKTSFYRLRQVDYDGTEDLSDILKVSREYTNNFMIVRLSSAYADKSIQVTLDSFKEGEMNYALIDWKGKKMLEGYMPLVYGLNKLEVDLSTYEPTIYHLEMEMDKEVERITIRKAADPQKKKDNVATTKRDKKD
jgi:hypothetical protein